MCFKMYIIISTPLPLDLDAVFVLSIGNEQDTTLARNKRTFGSWPNSRSASRSRSGYWYNYCPYPGCKGRAGPPGRKGDKVRIINVISVPLVHTDLILQGKPGPKGPIGSPGPPGAPGRCDSSQCTGSRFPGEKGQKGEKVCAYR